MRSIDPIPEYRNTYNDDKKSLLRGFRSYWSTKWLLNYHVSVIRTFAEMAFKITSKKKFNNSSAYSYSGYAQSSATQIIGAILATCGYTSKLKTRINSSFELYMLLPGTEICHEHHEGKEKTKCKTFHRVTVELTDVDC